MLIVTGPVDFSTFFSATGAGAASFFSAGFSTYFAIALSYLMFSPSLGFAFWTRESMFAFFAAFAFVNSSKEMVLSTSSSTFGFSSAGAAAFSSFGASVCGCCSLLM